MALERKDNIGDTTTTTGTGTLNLEAVAQSGARIFAGNVTSGATVRYDIRSSDNLEWEIGEGVFTDGTPDTLTRVTVYASSNAGSLVNFSAGTKNVSMVFTGKDAFELASQHRYAADAGSTDDYAITVNPAPTAYETGQLFSFRANTANTGEATLNVNSLGARPIRKKGTTVLSSNDILKGMLVEVLCNESTGLTTDSYSESNIDSDAILDNTFTRYGQIFLNSYAGITLKSCKFSMKKSGSPTGNLVAKVYAITGTPGTNAVPTGAALATSDNLDVATLTTSYVLTTLTFSGANQIELTGATWYAIVLEYTGTAVNIVNFGLDTGGSHQGNRTYWNGSWNGDNALDACFYVIGDIKRMEMVSQIAN